MRATLEYMVANADIIDIDRLLVFVWSDGVMGTTGMLYCTLGIADGRQSTNE